MPLCERDIGAWRDDLMVETHGHAHIHLGRALITDKYKYIYNERHMDELYELEKDPFEINNLINDEESSTILKDLKNRLQNWRIKTKDTMKKHMIAKIIAQKSQ